MDFRLAKSPNFKDGKKPFVIGEQAKTIFIFLLMIADTSSSVISQIARLEALEEKV